MNTFKRKSLYAALAGVGALGVTGAAQAVNINPDGLGQALVYPYYTTQGTSAQYNSLLSVVNSTASGKVVKVRFLEGKGSKEVLDFNLWLSPHDVWTTAVIASGAGAGIFTTDLSCTTPVVSSNPAAPTNFVNFAYVGDPEDQTLARTKEGYVEIIEMGEVTGATLAAITHVQPSPPGKPTCSGLASGATAPTDLVPGRGGLFGGISLVNVFAGVDVTYTATALTSFTATTLWGAPASIQPDLSQVNPKTSVVFNNIEVVTTDWSGSSNAVDAVSAVFMHDNVYNEFVLDTVTASQTSWVITMPTKHFYYTNNNVTKLFQRNFRAGGACDDVLDIQYNREEQTLISSTSFSPPPPVLVDALCWEANVLNIGGTGVLLSANAFNPTTPFANGWWNVNFLPGSVTGTTHQLVGGPTIRTSTATGLSSTQTSATYFGLPVVGFAAQYFNNGTLTVPGGTGVQAFYAGSFAHRYTRIIQ
ncbi:MAG TPA: hypothetical protein VEN29_19810 [Casimicrobiaceae bacterium]|nr:hypothetical protein [Casimicrobiaceae bacterium]